MSFCRALLSASGLSLGEAGLMDTPILGFGIEQLHLVGRRLFVPAQCVKLVPAREIVPIRQRSGWC
jgi:hypothetical protein